MGVPWGAPDDLNTFMAMVNNVPPEWTFSAFSLGRNQMAYVAAAVLAGGNVRVGLEDNLWLDKGVLATNAQLVERAVGIVEAHGRAGARAGRGAPEAQPYQARAGGALSLAKMVLHVAHFWPAGQLPTRREITRCIPRACPPALPNGEGRHDG